MTIGWHWDTDNKPENEDTFLVLLSNGELSLGFYNSSFWQEIDTFNELSVFQWYLHPKPLEK